MKSKTKKSLLFLASSLAMVVLAGGVGAMTQTVAQAAETNATTFEMLGGASIRTTDPTGIRFKVKLGSQYYNVLTQENTTSELHVALIPYTYYQEYQADSDKGEQALYPWLVAEYGATNILEVEIPSDKIYYTTDEETNESYYCGNAVISNVYFNNYHLDFVGVAYIENGTTYTDTTNITEADNARNIFEVACRASEDEEDYENYKDFLDATVEKGMYYAYGVRYNKQTQTYTWNEQTYTTYAEVQSALGPVVNQATVTLDDVVMELTDAKTLTATVAFSDGTAYEKNANFSWSVEDETIATVDKNGVVTAKKGGQTTVTVFALGGRISDTCMLTVREDVVTDYNFLAKSDAAVTAFTTGNANIDLKDTQINASEISAVLCGETPVAYSVNGTVLTLTDAPAGEQTYTFVTPKADYTVKALVYGYSIANKAEFLAWREAVSTAAWPGFMAYTILTADIDLEGAELDALNSMDGILDGRGYTVANFTITGNGLFAHVAETGGFRNIQFVNVTKTSASGILAHMMYGTVENVYIKATVQSDANHGNILCYGGGATTIIRNVIMDITATNVTHWILGQNWAAVPATLDNVHVYQNGTSSLNIVYTGTLDFACTNSGIYSSTADLANATKDFGAPWIVKEGQVPYLREKQTVVVDGTFLAKGDAAVTAFTTGNANIDLKDTQINASEISAVLCDETPVAYSVNGTVLTLTDAPAGENTYTLVGALKNYTVKALVYGYSISNKAEFLAWRNSTEDIRAYTILTADIDLAGESFAVANRDLSCILDGRGHTVANFMLPKTSLFTNVTVLGGYKNIQLVNVTQTWEAADGGWGILAKMMYGSAENILVKGNISGLGSVTHSGVLFYGGNDTTNVKNVIADITTDGTGTYFVGGVNWSLAPATLDNIHVAINATSAMTYGVATATNSGIYSSTADLANATQHFASPWIVEDGKVPYLSDYSRFLNNN